uniref:Uncharacterized protein n=1 Tax=Tanacetum cinerariifolium TaxID=118510 RepID=A0A699GIU0_TANCI|nr:hypothetical protein [Tanacetum cinerariifolium]
MGVDREGTQGQAVQGGAAARALDYASGGAGAAGRTDAPPARFDLVCAGDRVAAVERAPAGLGPGRSGAQDLVDTGRAVEERRGHPRVAEPVCGRCVTAPAGQAPGAGVHPGWLPGQPAQHQELARRGQAGGHPEFPLARPAAHVGQLAGAKRHPGVRPAGNGGVEVARHGAAVCAPGTGADVAPRGDGGSNAGEGGLDHKSVTNGRGGRQ